MWSLLCGELTTGREGTGLFVRVPVYASEEFSGFSRVFRYQESISSILNILAHGYWSWCTMGGRGIYGEGVNI